MEFRCQIPHQKYFAQKSLDRPHKPDNPCLPLREFDPKLEPSVLVFLAQQPHECLLECDLLEVLKGLRFPNLQRQSSPLFVELVWQSSLRREAWSPRLILQPKLRAVQHRIDAVHQLLQIQDQQIALCLGILHGFQSQYPQPHWPLPTMLHALQLYS